MIFEGSDTGKACNIMQIPGPVFDMNVALCASLANGGAKAINFHYIKPSSIYVVQDLSLDTHFKCM